MSTLTIKCNKCGATLSQSFLGRGKAGVQKIGITDQISSVIGSQTCSHCNSSRFDCVYNGIKIQIRSQKEKPTLIQPHDVLSASMVSEVLAKVKALFFSPVGSKENKDISKLNAVNRIGIRPETGPLTIQVGVDFGTSNTKVAYSIVGANQEVVPILFPRSNPSEAFCFPSLAAFDSQGHLVFGEEAVGLLESEPWDSGLRRFKMLIAGKHDSRYKEPRTESNYGQYLRRCHQPYFKNHPESLAVAFLTEIFRYTQKELRKKYTHNELKILFNVCMPIDHFEASALVQPFEKILAVAHQLAQVELEPLDALIYASEALKTASYDKNDPNARVFVIPEAVAEISSYTTSVLAKNGLHVLIDFGSGTSDISIFNLENLRTRSETWKWYAAANIPHGMNALEQVISDINPEFSVDEILHKLNSPEFFSDEETNSIRNNLQELWAKTSFAWADAYRHRQKQHCWKPECVQIFLSGGGASNSFMKDVFSRTGLQQIFSGWDYDHPIALIPVPENYRYDEQFPFQRMCLAYGLTKTIGELNKYILPKDAPDDTPPEIGVYNLSDLDLYAKDYSLATD